MTENEVVCSLSMHSIYKKQQHWHQQEQIRNGGGGGGGGGLEQERVTPTEACSLVRIIEDRTPGHMLSNNGLCLCNMCRTCYYF